MPNHHPILTTINNGLDRFGAGSAKLRTKLTGALAAEVVRQHLRLDGFPVSQRNVFIRGLPSELDLLVTSPGAQPEHDLIYEPTDVRAVLEIKYSGIYDRDVVPRLRECFAMVRSKCERVFCACVVIYERKGFRFAANATDLGDPVYTLHWWTGQRENAEDTGEWSNLIHDLSSHITSAV
jgi:hypothetical protein